MKFLKLQKNGDASQEFVAYEATEDGNTAGYAIIDKTYKYGSISNVHQHVYFFPAVNVLKGELIVLLTGKGKNSKGKLDRGRVIHRFYWGSDAAIWNDLEQDAATLIKYDVISTSASATPIKTSTDNPFQRKLKRS